MGDDEASAASSGKYARYRGSIEGEDSAHTVDVTQNLSQDLNKRNLEIQAGY